MIFIRNFLQNKTIQWLLSPSSLLSPTVSYDDCQMRMHVRMQDRTRALGVDFKRNRFKRSTSVDIIRVSAGVTVTVESKQQIWTKQSLPQRYVCVGYQLSSDQALRLLYLKGHVRAREPTL